ncbi:MAG: ankyrin repeat domain-containing protein [Alphaproteobacteria bacterium]
MIEKLINSINRFKYKLNYDIKNFKRETLLVRSVELGSLTLVKFALWLEAKPEVFYRNYTVLGHAAIKGNIKILELLLTKDYTNCTIRKRDQTYGTIVNTPINAVMDACITAAAYGNVKALKLLLDFNNHKADINDLNITSYENRAVYFASINNQVECLKVLVSYGAKIDEYSKELIIEKCPAGTLEKLEKIIPLKTRKSASELNGQMVEFSKKGLPFDINCHIASFVPEDNTLSTGTVRNIGLAAHSFVQNRYNSLSRIEQIGRKIYNYIPGIVYNTLPSCITNIINSGPKLSLKDSFNNTNQIESNKERLYR